ncbi:hypothetical protein ACIBH1_44690 [Nonomuraea sp. NPDC050663]|uniref:hypothetical protein n=1 Tax=Nonomuraea sp. NPDC050663 TaxID=3364370 RepID=UPI0037B97880
MMIRALDGIAVLSYGIDLGGPGRWHLPTTAAGHPDLTWYDPDHPRAHLRRPGRHPPQPAVRCPPPHPVRRHP